VEEIVMKRELLISVSAILALGACAVAQGQSTGVQASGQTGGQASVQAGNQHAQASTTTSTSASSSASTNSGSANAGLSSGTTFNTSLTKPVDAKKAKAGDKVEAKTTEAVKAGKKTVLPKGTKLVGHVTQASARAKGDAESSLAIAFDRAILKDGTEVPLNVGIQALATSETMVSGSEADADSFGTAGAGAAGTARGGLGGVTSAAGGVVGGTANTAGSVVNTAGRVPNVAGEATANVAGTARGATGGLNAAGQLTSNSRGVFGLNGLKLNSAAANATQGSVITSADKNIHLASGTRMLLVTHAAAGPGQ
jgi:hypothetical protein